MQKDFSTVGSIRHFVDYMEVLGYSLIKYPLFTQSVTLLLNERFLVVFNPKSMVPPFTMNVKSPKPNRRWLQYSLRSLVLVCILLCCTVGFFCLLYRKANQQQKIVEWIEDNSGQVVYENQIRFNSKGEIEKVPDEKIEKNKWIPLPESTSEWLGKDFQWNVKLVLMLRNEKVDISPFAEIEGLEYVLLHGESSDLSPLLKCRSLRSLQLEKLTSSDLDVVSRLFILEELSFVTSGVSDLSELRSLSNLKSISLGGMKNHKINFLNHLSHLENIYITSSSGVDLTPIFEKERLKALSFYNSEINDLTPLANLLHLESLDLNSIEAFHFEPVLLDLEPLTSLKALTSLDLFGREYQSLEPITKMKQLTYFSVYTEDPNDLDFIVQLENLESLMINIQGVEDFSPLHKLKKLKQINFTVTHISDDQKKQLRQSLPDCKIFGYGW